MSFVFFFIRPPPPPPPPPPLLSVCCPLVITQSVGPVYHPARFRVLGFTQLDNYQASPPTFRKCYCYCQSPCLPLPARLPVCQPARSPAHMLMRPPTTLPTAHPGRCYSLATSWHTWQVLQLSHIMCTLAGATA